MWAIFKHFSIILFFPITKPPNSPSLTKCLWIEQFLNPVGKIWTLRNCGSTYYCTLSYKCEDIYTCVAVQHKTLDAVLFSQQIQTISVSKIRFKRKFLRQLLSKLRCQAMKRRMCVTRGSSRSRIMHFWCKPRRKWVTWGAYRKSLFSLL